MNLLLFVHFLFRYDNYVKKENKDTLTDRLEWNDETVCSCSDVENGFTGKCLLCGGNNQTYHTTPRRDDSHDSMKDSKSMSVQKIRKKKKKKRQRFSFLPRNFHDRKRGKDPEDRDRKCVRRKNPGTIKQKNVQDASQIFIEIIL